MSRCLYCYQPIEEEKSEFHSACSGKIFGTPNPPELPYSEDQMFQLAEKVVKSQTAVTGVQPKLS
ncbi:MAG TPA: type II toxin-antitoxin system HipA family toxin, partial [Chitinophagaceae bacterium]|nr:type II toxin-antitoxin system HipA family toxin [Chitinophagaceae bacterium]